jgi:peptidoglycan-N-acetylglucosamine deacetylase
LTDRGKLKSMRYLFQPGYRLFALATTVLLGVATIPASADQKQDIDSVVTGLAPGLGNGLIMSGATSHRLIHFTFDDGPDPYLTPRLLDKLDAVSVKATFFFSASRFRGREKRNAHAVEIAQEILRRGHTIGSHSVDHKRMHSMNRQAIQNQLDENDVLFRRVFGDRVWLFRPPHGSRSPLVDEMLAERGYTTVLWNIGMADWVARSADQVLSVWRRVLSRRERESGEQGGIVLLHDTHAWSVEAFGLIYTDIVDRNCRLLDSGEELYDVVDDLRFFYTKRGDSRPGVFAPTASPDPAILAARQSKIRHEMATRCVKRARPQEKPQE